MDRQMETLERAILRILAVLLSLITIGVFAHHVLESMLLRQDFHFLRD